MKIAVIMARTLLGLPFLIFGLNDFFRLFPMQPIPGDAGVLVTIMYTDGWLIFDGLLYVIAGVLLLVGRYVPVALVILGPIIVNILVFHLTLLPSGIGAGVVFAGLEIFLIFSYWPAFRGVFTPRFVAW